MDNILSANIEMTYKFGKEVNDMCNISDGIVKDAVERGLAQGVTKGKWESTQKIAFKMIRRGDGDSEIIDFLEITPEELEQIKSEYNNG